MCFSSKVPEPKPLPPTPTIDDDAVRQRQRQEQARLAATGGRATTLKSDLAPSDVTGTKKVLLGV
jgi:hypothetical protein